MGEKISNTKEKYLYHNTEKLLKKHRDILWSIEVATLQKEKDFEVEMEYSAIEFLDMPYSAMEDLKGAKVEKQIEVFYGAVDFVDDYFVKATSKRSPPTFFEEIFDKKLPG